MDDELLQYQLKSHEGSIKELDTRVDKLENSTAATQVEIRNLCRDVSNLVNVLKWFIGLFLGGGVGLIFYVIQKSIK